MSLPIRARLTVWYTALLAAILLSSGIFLVLRTHADQLHHIDDSLTLAGNEISVDFPSGGESEFLDITDASLGGLPRSQSVAQILTSTGQVLNWAGDPLARRPILSSAALSGTIEAGSVLRTMQLGPARDGFRVLTLPFNGHAGSSLLLVGTSLAEVDQSVRRLVMLLLVAGPGALAGAAAGGWWLAKTALSPVARMTAKAGQIGADRLTERVEVPRTADELHALALTLNAMLDRLAAAVEQQRRFAADASHELRTPLAVMRSELDVSLDSRRLPADAREVLESAREEIDRMSRTVNDLLLLARTDQGGLELDRGPVDLFDLAAEVASRIRPVAERRGVRIEVRGVPVWTQADRSRLEQVVSNLVDNAVKYSGGRGTVEVSTWHSDGQAGLTVTDAGRGMSPDVVAHVFDRFFRADPARGRDGEGSGLGLAICKGIVEAHGGRIWATTEPGEGSAFSVALPRASPSRPR